MKYYVHLGAVRFEIKRPLTRWERIRCWFSPWRYEAIGLPEPRFTPPMPKVPPPRSEPVTDREAKS